jgi:diguanylate cyclase (GGDEF)-like protein
VANLRDNLTGWVVREGKPLLIRSLSREYDSLPVKPEIVGQDKLSESWLGVPMIADDRVIGVLVVASYAENAYTDEDASLLGTVASQAALALENARNFAEVQEQSRRDSLTGVLNHGYFITRLVDEIEKAQVAVKPVTLIMLDIDHFKIYNDTYGHILGDEVLRLTAQAIQNNIKSTDLVGRWGGEEFSVALPDTDIQQAQQVADRIRKTLAGLALHTSQGAELPKPTVSQGIAAFPEHAANARRLVDLADHMLYGAKRGGRDQVQVFDGLLEPFDENH